MNTAFRKSFARDLKKIKGNDIRERVQEVIEQVDEATELLGSRNLKKMTGTANYYRIRIGDYRIGVVVEGDTVEFVRCLSRRDLYRYFP
ncbi:MAG: type II toxin-antitoxin system mRNA interferase toxin, RelE/StbE family [Gemmataceae bacterium]|nr:type II toxin-antitoxin system mRNA interferase toxin, RelE/StbE family [Gemmataceae bacterium]MCI0742165.1 type II toxin-antitoxin system mRNA interferase toxin, RelE/StbE family [Gemmataceae bacterium]